MKLKTEQLVRQAKGTCLFMFIQFVLVPAAAFSHKLNTTNTQVKCSLKQFQCGDGSCVPFSWVCDGNNDCPTGDDENSPLCNSLKECEKDQFKCGNNVCIPLSWKCDNEKDCADDSDETPETCWNSMCTEDEFTCASYPHECIPKNWKCDGHRDCEDGSDEDGCKKACAPHEFTCDNGNCISSSLKCNSFNDCGDKSDEKNCPKRSCSPSSEHTCGDGHCISKSWLCDGDFDCLDQSDEKNCTKKHAQPVVDCTIEPEHCLNDPHCLQQPWICDGSKDCLNGFDESPILCKHFSEDHCPQGAFQCYDGSCIPEQLVCSGIPDCPDGSDENNCIYAEMQADAEAADDETFSEVQADGIQVDAHDISEEKSQSIYRKFAQIIHKNIDEQAHTTSNNAESQNRDKTNNDDTKQDSVHKEECNSLTHKKCGPKCLPIKEECHENVSQQTVDIKQLEIASHKVPMLVATIENNQENKQQTKTSSGDEDVQTIVKANEKTTQDQHSSKHSHHEKVYIHPYNSQKHHTFHYKQIPSPKKGCLQGTSGCSQNCIKTTQGFLCECLPGFELNIHNKCEDIDECKSLGMCSQKCENSYGSYKCSCEEGFHLDPKNPTSCLADAPGYLLLATHYGIRNISTETRTSTEAVKQYVAPKAVDYSFEDGLIFWSDVKLRSIYKMKIGEPESAVVLVHNVLTEAIAVNWVQKTLFWTDPEKAAIEMIDFAGKNRKVIVEDDLTSPRGIAVDPEEGLIFWSDWGNNPKIEKAGLDGSSRLTIVLTRIGWPNGITLDLRNKRILWVDAKLHQLFSSNYSGRDRNMVVSSEIYLKQPFSIAVFEDWVYWADWDKSAVYRANKYDGADMENVAPLELLESPMGLKVYHSLVQPKVEDKCHEISCSYMCLLKPSIDGSGVKPTCVCPDRATMQPDGSCLPDEPSTMKTTETSSFTFDDSEEDFSYDYKEESSTKTTSTKEQEDNSFSNTDPIFITWVAILLTVITFCGGFMFYVYRKCLYRERMAMNFVSANVDRKKVTNNFYTENSIHANEEVYEPLNSYKFRSRDLPV